MRRVQPRAAAAAQPSLGVPVRAPVLWGIAPGARGSCLAGVLPAGARDRRLHLVRAAAGGIRTTRELVHDATIQSGEGGGVGRWRARRAGHLVQGGHGRARRQHCARHGWSHHRHADQRRQIHRESGWLRDGTPQCRHHRRRRRLRAHLTATSVRARVPACPHVLPQRANAPQRRLAPHLVTAGAAPAARYAQRGGLRLVARRRDGPRWRGAGGDPEGIEQLRGWRRVVMVRDGTAR